MKYQVSHIPTGKTTRGFKSEDEAWDYVVNNCLCDVCFDLHKKGETEHCSAEWDIEEQDSLWERLLIWIRWRY